MTKYLVYVSDYDFADLSIEKSVLEPIGAEVIGLQCKTGEGLAELARDADVILQQYAKIPRETLAKLKNCKGICRYGIGVDIVDVEAAYEYGMVVTNVPDYCIDEVGDHTLAMGLMLLRRIPMYNKAAKEGRWHWQEAGAPIFRFRTITWGLIGYGRIAQNIARKLQGISISVIAFDPYVSESYMKSTGVKKVDLATLLAEADVVNVMTPYTPETHHLIDERALRLMKPHGVLLNCARGKIVDNKALYRALTEGWIASAGLDDTEEEPAKLEKWNPRDNPLFSLDNCIITPHVAYISENSLQEARKTAAENAKAVLLGQTPPNLVRPFSSA
ncbi:MAG: C-terminal binding protein [Bacillota bacterium]